MNDDSDFMKIVKEHRCDCGAGASKLVDEILERLKVPEQCYCGGALIEVRLDYKGPITCGEPGCFGSLFDENLSEAEKIRRGHVIRLKISIEASPPVDDQLLLGHRGPKRS